MTDLATVLAKMLDEPHVLMTDPAECDCGDWDSRRDTGTWNDHYRDEMLATPEGKALAALVEARTLGLIRNCVEACANDPREPQRYRRWYADALARIDAYHEATR